MKINGLPEIENASPEDFLILYDTQNNITGKIKLSNINFGSTPITTNISSLANVSASSFYNSQYSPQNVTDGNLTTEWASLGQTNPWIQLDFSSSKKISKVRLSDRPNLIDSANTGTLTFSDGSSINIADIPNDGTFKIIEFNQKTVTWIRFQVAGGSGPNVGLTEFEVWGY